LIEVVNARLSFGIITRQLQQVIQMLNKEQNLHSRQPISTL
jgi:hypothetical protein